MINVWIKYGQLKLAFYIQTFSQRRLVSTKLLSQGFIKNCLVLSFKKFFRRYQPFKKVFCQLRTDDKIQYWQFYFGSKLTIDSLLCLTMALCTS